MIVAVFLSFSLLLQSIDALTWREPAGPFAPFIGIQLPTYEWMTQWQSEDPRVWGKNYTIVPSPDGFGCQVPPPGYAVGKIVTSLGPPNDECWPWQMAEYAKQGGAVAVLLTTPFPQIFGMYHTTGPTPWTFGQGNLPPVVTWGNLNPTQPVSQQVPLSLVAYTAFQMFGSINVTLDYPSQNPLFSEYYQIPSQMSFLTWFGFALAMCSVTYITGKLFLDVQYSGLRVALPLVVLLFCYGGSVMIVFLSLVSFAGVISPAHIHASGFLILFPYTCSTSACVLIGFYFTETAHLTSQKQIGLLDRLKIPGYIAIGLIWVVFFVVSAVGTFYRSGNPADTGSVGPGYAIAVTYGILALFALFLALFGGVSVVRTMPDVSETKRGIRLTVALVVSASLVNLTFLSLVITLRWWVFDAFAVICTERQILLIFDVFWVWPPALIYIMLGSVFRVSLTKEIEISKTGTSSRQPTSYSSSSLLSSSSSRHPEDVQAIEL